MAQDFMGGQKPKTLGLEKPSEEAAGTAHRLEKSLQLQEQQLEKKTWWTSLQM